MRRFNFKKVNLKMYHACVQDQFEIERLCFFENETLNGEILFYVLSHV